MSHNPLIEQYELIRETHYRFDNIEPKIKSRIYKIIKGAKSQYTWEANYYCRLESEGSVYTPGSPFGSTLEEIEYKLDSYMSRFEQAISWSVNNSF